MVGRWTIHRCASCDAPLEGTGKPTLFCSELCTQTAEVVRYARRRLADGGIDDPLVAEVVRVRVAHLIGGGYHRIERALPKAVRVEVLAFNGGRCVTCDVQPATEVDHIDGDSATRANLQGLCGPCHRAKTAESMRSLSAADDPAVLRRAQNVIGRIESDDPSRRCDDPDEWPTIWRALRAATRDSQLRTSASRGRPPSRGGPRASA